MTGVLRTVFTKIQKPSPKAQSVALRTSEQEVIPTGFIPLSTMVMWESSHWLGKNVVRSSGQKNCRKAWIGALAAVT